MMLASSMEGASAPASSELGRARGVLDAMAANDIAQLGAIGVLAPEKTPPAIVDAAATVNSDGEQDGTGAGYGFQSNAPGKSQRR